MYMKYQVCHLGLWLCCISSADSGLWLQRGPGRIAQSAGDHQVGIHKVCSWVKIVRILHSLFQDNTFLPEFWQLSATVSTVVTIWGMVAPPLVASMNWAYSPRRSDRRSASPLPLESPTTNTQAGMRECQS